MKSSINRKFVILILICLGMFSMAWGQKKTSFLPLPTLWKLTTGDSAVYANPAFDDSGWNTVAIGKNWESQGHPGYDGVGWYRTRISIPYRLKETKTVPGILGINLGRIDDADQVYINGQKIGETDGWDKDRIYFIPDSVIRWEKDNVISVRVVDKSGNGGMYAGPYWIGPVKLADVLSLKTSDAPRVFSSANLRFGSTLLFHFKTQVQQFSAILHVKIYDPESMVVVFRKEDTIRMGGIADTSYHFAATLTRPGRYKLEYSLSSETREVKVIDSALLTYTTLFSYVPGAHVNEHLAYPIVNPFVPFKATPFPLENMVFGGYLNERLNANLVQRLLRIDETGILECYYNRPGSQTWVGEYTGKYLHAASRVWRSTHNMQLKNQMDRIADILISCQNKDGYLGTYLPANYWTEWDVWAHKYNLLGLLSYYAATGYKPALEASIKMGDILCKTFGENKGQLNIINSSYHEGMASTSVLEPMTELYRFTGDKKYLRFCYYILKAYGYPNGPHIITSLNTTGKVDKVADGKAYEMMSNFTGIVKMYQLTRDEKLLRAVQAAWSDITAHKLYITGTASASEVFQPDFILPADNNVSMGEGCVTTTWLQFNQALYYLTGKARYMDEIEKSIYNHLFAAENPETGCVSYYTALQGAKPYSCSINGNCCLASVPRGIAAIPELVFTRRAENGLNINLYSVAALQDKIQSKDGSKLNLRCAMASKFPEAGEVTITLSPEKKSQFVIALRVPVWCKNFMASVDGKSFYGTPGTYLSLDQVWNKNSVIKINFDLNNVMLNGGQSYPGYAALKLGSQVLAADQTLNPGIELDKVKLIDSTLVPALKMRLPEGWVGTGLFKTKSSYEGKIIELVLVPFADAGQTGSEVRVWLKKK